MHELSELEDPLRALLLEERHVERHECIQRVDHPQHQRRHVPAHELHLIGLLLERRPLDFLRGDERIQLAVVDAQRLVLTQRRLVLREKRVGVVSISSRSIP